jgi:hypothetical protein
MINGSPSESRSSVTDFFALAVIIGDLSRQSLILGLNEQSTQESQFQDEFYRASFKHANGCAVLFPECGTRKGSVDFFIQSKKWRVELLRNGNRLTQHIKQFTRGEYDRWIKTMSGYIIIDFRTYQASQNLF